MSSLDSLGFEPRSDVNHEQVIAPDSLSPDMFFKDAKVLLDELDPIVEADVIPKLAELEGTWHPLGFMVYHLGVHPDHGSLRLHVWPLTLRRYVEGASGHHNHGWHVASKVLAGEYRDERYKIAETSRLPLNRRLPEGWLRVFKTRTPVDGDALFSDGTIVKLSEPDPEIRVSPGDHHLLTPDQIHIPTVPMARLAVTLVLDSPSFGVPPSILINGRLGPTSFHEPRPRVSSIEGAMASEQALLGIAAAKTRSV